MSRKISDGSDGLRKRVNCDPVFCMFRDPQVNYSTRSGKCSRLSDPSELNAGHDASAVPSHLNIDSSLD